MEDITCGVPQCSYLSPLLFLIYIKDLTFCLQSSEAIYADDTTISYSFRSARELSAKLNCQLHCLEEWLHGNELSINETKTQAMIVASQPNLKKITSNASEAPCFVNGDTNIDIVQRAKYLGVKLDQHLV